MGIEVEHRDRPSDSAVCEGIIAVPGPARWDFDTVATGNIIGDGTVDRCVLPQARIEEIVHINMSANRVSSLSRDQS